MLHYLQLYYKSNYCMLCIIQFQQSGTVYTQILIEVSNLRYSNASATAVRKRTPLPWTKTMYCIRADMSLQYLDHCLFFSFGLTNRMFLYRMNRSNLKIYSFFREGEFSFDSDKCLYMYDL